MTVHVTARGALGLDHPSHFAAIVMPNVRKRDGEDESVSVSVNRPTHSTAALVGLRAIQKPL